MKYFDSQIKFILPVYNEEDRINSTLDYCIRDLGIKENLIIIDAFSQDKTKLLVDEYIKKFKFISLLSKKNDGTTETQEWVNWLLENIKSKYYIFLSCSEKITKKTLDLYKTNLKKDIDLIYVNRKSMLNNNDISYIYSNLFDVLFFKKTYMPLCRFASYKGLKIINTSIHDNWLTESKKVNTLHKKQNKYSILHFKRGSFIKNSYKHLDYAKLESNKKNLIPISYLRFLREFIYLLLLTITFRINRAIFIELNLRMIYHLQKIGFKLEKI